MVSTYLDTLLLRPLPFRLRFLLLLSKRSRSSGSLKLNFCQSVCPDLSLSFSLSPLALGGGGRDYCNKENRIGVFVNILLTTAFTLVVPTFTTALPSFPTPPSSSSSSSPSSSSSSSLSSLPSCPCR